MLYRATHDERYLQQARRMAEWFRKFDALPTDHSHGNLCAWRGILELYDLTGEGAYLERALAKWATAVHDGYVWSIGGVGEHWHMFHGGDEGCSESDWLRFNLELWRCTGETRFLDMAERLLHNQYPANQCANGGYGWRRFDGDGAGPIATRGDVAEWNFCCSFHGPLGLHFLNAYLAAGSERGLFVNFPLDFTAPVKSGGQEWRVTVRTVPGPPSLAETQPERLGTPRLTAAWGPEKEEFEVEVASIGETKPARTTLWLRQPEWAANVRVSQAGLPPRGSKDLTSKRRRAATETAVALPFTTEHGYIRLERQFSAGARIRVTFEKGLRLEGEGYADYRFEFDLELPAASQGITGWVVRAQGAGDCLHFQLQTADSTYDAPQYKTHPNTLRPHVRRNGEWTIADPVPLPREVRRGETHHIAMECRGPEITVFLDGARLFSQPDAGFRTGAVGFRAAGAAEQGLFRNVAMHKL